MPCDVWDLRATLSDVQQQDEFGWHRHIGLIGQTQCGKSYLQRQIILGRSRVVAFDPEWQFGGGRRNEPLPGFVLCHEPGELKRVLRERLGAGFRVVYQPGFQLEEHFNAVLQLVWAAEDCTLAIDEVAHFCKPNWMPQLLGAMCLRGSHRNISLVWTSQRPQDAHPRLRDASKMLCVFRLQDNNSLRWLQARSVPPEIITEVPRLPDREYFYQDSQMHWRKAKP